LTQDFQCADQNQNPKVQTPAGRPLCWKSLWLRFDSDDLMTTDHLEVKVNGIARNISPITIQPKLSRLNSDIIRITQWFVWKGRKLRHLTISQAGKPANSRYLSKKRNAQICWI
jgi:hypothetical protein